MASIALRIFNFPPMFSSVDVREFLHLFGLETVRFIKRRNADGAIVVVNNESEARLVIARLHQLLIKTHRLKVEYSNENEPDSSAGKEATSHKAVGMPEQRCFPIGFEGFPPPHLAYRYPKSSPEILENITKELASNSALYYQTLHLMNKMNLKPPFESRQKENTITPIAPEQSSQAKMHSGNLSEEESELESDSELDSTRKTKTSYNLLKHTMKVVNYEPSSVELQTTQKPPKKAKLEINISGALLTAPPPASPGNDTVPETAESIPYTQEEAPTLSIEDIVSNRIPDEQRKTLNVFQNYSPGEPTNKLYIKNLAKQVTEQDLMALFGMFFQAKLLKTIDVRLMKTGRMKGQAFVTFVPVEEDEDSPGCGRFRQCIERALSTVNGYILKDKPIVVSYAKSV